MIATRFILFFSLCVVLKQTVLSQSNFERYELLRKGEQLSKEEAEKLEQIAETESTNVEAHIQLLGYYYRGKRKQLSGAKESHMQLVLELVENNPALPILDVPEAFIDHTRNPDGYAKAHVLWQRNIATHKDNPRVLANAARFYLRTDKALVESLLQQAQILEPTNPEWSRELANHYQRNIHRATGKEKIEVAAKSLEQFELAEKQYDDLMSTYWLLADLAAVSFEAEDFEKAEQYSSQLLRMSKLPKFKRRTGNAVHHGNLVLGRLALKAGNKDKAKSHLLAAGGTTGSPQLNSFGPNMTLAKELLEQGEKDIVLEYFRLCSKFWQREELDEWAKVVEEGGKPDFGGNLRY